MQNFVYPLRFPRALILSPWKKNEEKNRTCPFSNSKKYFEYISQTVIKMMNRFLRTNRKHAPFWYYYKPHISIGYVWKLSVYSGLNINFPHYNIIAGIPEENIFCCNTVSGTTACLPLSFFLTRCKSRTKPPHHSSSQSLWRWLIVLCCD